LREELNRYTKKREMENNLNYSPDSTVSFFEQPQVETDMIPIGEGVPLGVECVFHAGIGIGGAYGTWGESYDNEALFRFLEHRFGEPLREEDRMNLSALGFVHRHHVPELSDEEHLELEVEVGARFLREAAKVNGWKPEEVEGVFIGMSGPVADDYTERIAKKAGIPEGALKISVHKACDSSMGALHLMLNPDLVIHHQIKMNIAKEMYGKKVLVGGIEGLSRLFRKSRDISALQLFGNGAGVIGVIPGQTMKFLVGKPFELYDEKGTLAFTMCYPHSGQRQKGQSMIEVSQAGYNHHRFAGLMHEPGNGVPIEMAGPLGMVKLFVRTGVQVVCDVFSKYQALMDEMGMAKKITVAIVHHANLKINLLKAKRLRDIGVHIPMPWMLSEFGNVSAASNVIAFLRQLSNLKPGDHVLFDGFGAGTYYDTFSVALGDQA
jgi:3-oxoacyl-[acyl-carrier-protein] synthase III